MKYCQHCGQEVREEAVVCIHCGCAIGKAYEVAKKEEDKNSTGLNVLSFFIPIVGLILFCVNIKEKPIMAKNIGKYALIGFIINCALLTLANIY